MAIMTDNLGNGTKRTYSSEGMMIENNGVKYVEAIDLEHTDRTYQETDEPIIPDDMTLDDVVMRRRASDDIFKDVCETLIRTMVVSKVEILEIIDNPSK